MTNEIQQAPENLENGRDQIIRDLSDKVVRVSEEIERLKQEMGNYEQQYEILALKMHIAEMTREGADYYLNHFFENESSSDNPDFMEAVEAMMRTYALTRSIEKSDEAGRKILHDTDDVKKAKYYVAALSPLGPNYCWDWGAQDEYYIFQDDYECLSSSPDYSKDKAMAVLYSRLCNYNSFNEAIEYQNALKLLHQARQAQNYYY